MSRRNAASDFAWILPLDAAGELGQLVRGERDSS